MNKYKRLSILAIALTIGLSALCTAASMATPVLSGQVCSENVGKLTNEISWSRSLDKVKEEAAQQNKLILWVHMVGKIDGFT